MSVAASLPQWQRREKLVALLLLGPAVLYLLALSIYPTIYSLWIAFHNYSLYRRDLVSFTGFDNFTDLLDSDVFKQSFAVTLIFAFSAVAIELALGFAIAVLLDRKMRAANVLRTLLIIPVLISPVAMGLTFRYIFAPTYGLLTYLMKSVHLPTADWTVSVTWALPVVIFADVWQWTPFVALILLSGMQSVSTEVTEAAELDGLTEWQKLWRIVVPLIRPVLLVVVLIRLDRLHPYVRPRLCDDARRPGLDHRGAQPVQLRDRFRFRRHGLRLGDRLGDRRAGQHPGRPFPPLPVQDRLTS